MRTVIVFSFACAVISAQNEPPQEPAAVPPLRLEVTPLAPPDPDSPYASPRDAARHRLQATLAELQSGRNVKAAVRGFAEALRLDRTYAPAAWNLAIVAALEQKWNDAISAMGEAMRLDPAGFGKPGAAQVERLRAVESLSKTPEGQRKLRYDVALYGAIRRMEKSKSAESMATLADLGRLDPKRWEAPALLAGLTGDGSGYDVAAKFLEIAVSNAAEAATRQTLNAALRAARRELSYAGARASAEAASDRGEYRKAAELYEAAWTAIPARAANGMDAAADWLAEDDTAHAAAVLLRLKQSGDSSASELAGRMIDEIKSIEPAAGKPAPDASAFFRDPGLADPPRISDLLPRVDTASMEVLARPLPRMVEDAAPVVLLAALDANRTDASPPVSLPQLAPPRMAGDRPWNELQALRETPPTAIAPERERETADAPGNARTRRLVSVTTQPQGAYVFWEESAEPLCQTPCDIRAGAGAHQIHVALAGFDNRTSEVNVTGPRTEVDLPLSPARGTVLVEGSAPAGITVNGTAAGKAPIEMSLAPGIYRIAQEGGPWEQFVTVRPGARLRLTLKP